MSHFMQILCTFLERPEIDTSAIISLLKDSRFSSEIGELELVRGIIENGSLLLDQNFLTHFKGLVNQKLSEKLEEGTMKIISKIKPLENSRYIERVSTSSKEGHQTIEDTGSGKKLEEVNYYVFAPEQMDEAVFSYEITEKSRDREGVFTDVKKVLTANIYSNSFLRSKGVTEGIDYDHKFTAKDSDRGVVDYEFYCFIDGLNNDNYMTVDSISRKFIITPILNFLSMEYINPLKDASTVFSIVRTNNLNKIGKPVENCLKINTYKYFLRMIEEYNTHFGFSESAVAISDYIGLCHIERSSVILVPETFKVLCEDRTNVSEDILVTLPKKYLPDVKAKTTNLKTEHCSIDVIKDKIEVTLKAPKSKNKSKPSFENACIELSLSLGSPPSSIAKENTFNISASYILLFLEAYLIKKQIKDIDDSEIKFDHEQSDFYEMRGEDPFIKASKKLKLTDTLDKLLQSGASNETANQRCQDLLSLLLRTLVLDGILICTRNKVSESQYKFTPKMKDEKVYIKGKPVPQYESITNITVVCKKYTVRFDLTLNLKWEINLFTQIKNYFLKLFLENDSGVVTVNSKNDYTMLLPSKICRFTKSKNQPNAYINYQPAFPFMDIPMKAGDEIMTSEIYDGPMIFSRTKFFFQQIIPYKILDIKQIDAIGESNIICYLVTFDQTMNLTLETNSPRPLDTHNIDENNIVYLMRRSLGAPVFVDKNIIVAKTEDVLSTINVKKTANSYVYLVKKIMGEGLFVSIGNTVRFEIESMNSNEDLITMSSFFRKITEDIFNTTGNITTPIKDFCNILMNECRNEGSPFTDKNLASMIGYLTILSDNNWNFTQHTLAELDIALDKSLRWCSIGFQMFIRSISMNISSNKKLTFTREIVDKMRLKRDIVLNEIVASISENLKTLSPNISDREKEISRFSGLDKIILRELGKFSAENIRLDNIETYNLSNTFLEIRAQFDEFETYEGEIDADVIRSLNEKDVRVFSSFISIIREIANKEFSSDEIIRFLSEYVVETADYQIINSGMYFVIMSDSIETILAKNCEEYKKAEISQITTEGVLSESGERYIFSPNFAQINNIRRNIPGNNLIHAFATVIIDKSVENRDIDSLIYNICSKCLIYKGLTDESAIEMSNIVVEKSFVSSDESKTYTLYLPFMREGSHLMLKRPFYEEEGVSFSCITKSLYLAVNLKEFKDSANPQREAFRSLISSGIIQLRSDPKLITCLWSAFGPHSLKISTVDEYLVIFFNLDCLDEMKEYSTVESGVYLSLSNFYKVYANLLKYPDSIEQSANISIEYMENLGGTAEIIEALFENEINPEVFKTMFTVQQYNVDPMDVLCITDFENEKITTETYGFTNPYEVFYGGSGIIADKSLIIKALTNSDDVGMSRNPFDVYKHKMMNMLRTKTIKKELAEMAMANVEISLSSGIVFDVSDESLGIFRRGTVLWKEFSENKRYLAVGLINSVLIYNYIAGKYYNISTLQHESVTGITFGNSIYCVTISKSLNAKSVKLWIIPSGTHLEIHIPIYTYRSGDVVDATYVSADKYENISKKPITKVVFNDPNAVDYGTVSGYEDPKLIKPNGDNIMSEAEFNARFKVSYIDTFKSGYGTVTGYNDLALLDINKMTDKEIKKLNGRTKMTEEEFLTRFKKIYTDKNNFSSVSSYNDPVLLKPDGTNIITEVEFEKRFVPEYRYTNKILTNIVGNGNYDTYFFSESDIYLVYNYYGSLRILNLKTLKHSKIVNQNGVTYDNDNELMSVVSGSWNYNSTVFIGVTRDKLKTIRLTLKDKVFTAVVRPILSAFPTGIVPIDIKMKGVKTNTVFCEFQYKLDALPEEYSNFFWMYTTFVSYNLEDGDEIKIIFSNTDGFSTLIKIRETKDKSQDKNQIMKSGKEIVAVNLTDFLVFFKNTFTVTFDETTSKTTIRLLGKNVFDIGSEMKLLFDLPCIIEKTYALYIQGNDEIITTHAYFLEGVDYKTSIQVYEKDTTIDYVCFGNVTPIHCGDFFLASGIDDLHIVDMKTSSSIHDERSLDYKTRKSEISNEDIEVVVYNIISAVDYSDRVIDIKEGVDNFPISKYLCMNRFPKFAMSEFSQITYQKLKKMTLGNLVLIADGKILRVFPRYVQINTSVGNYIDSTVHEFFRNSSKEEFVKKYQDILSVIRSVSELFPSFFYTNEPHIYKLFPTRFKDDTFDQFKDYIDRNIVKNESKSQLDERPKLDMYDERVKILIDESMFVLTSPLLKRDNIADIVIALYNSVYTRLEKRQFDLEAKLATAEADYAAATTKEEGFNQTKTKTKGKKGKNVVEEELPKMTSGEDQEKLQTMLDEIAKIKNQIANKDAKLAEYQLDVDEKLERFKLLVPDVPLPSRRFFDLLKYMKTVVTDVANEKKTKVAEAPKKKGKSLAQSVAESSFEEVDKALTSASKTNDLLISKLMNPINDLSQEELDGKLIAEFVNILKYQGEYYGFSPRYLTTFQEFKNEVVKNVMKISNSMSALLEETTMFDKYGNIPYEELITKTRELAIEYYSMSQDFFMINDTTAKEFSLMAPKESLYNSDEKNAALDCKEFKTSLNKYLKIQVGDEELSVLKLTRKLSGSLNPTKRSLYENKLHKLETEIEKLVVLRFKSLTSSATKSEIETENDLNASIIEMNKTMIDNLKIKLLEHLSLEKRNLYETEIEDLNSEIHKLKSPKLETVSNEPKVLNESIAEVNSKIQKKIKTLTEFVNRMINVDELFTKNEAYETHQKREASTAQKRGEVYQQDQTSPAYKQYMDRKLAIEKYKLVKTVVSSIVGDEEGTIKVTNQKESFGVARLKLSESSTKTIAAMISKFIEKYLMSKLNPDTFFPCEDNVTSAEYIHDINEMKSYFDVLEESISNEHDEIARLDALIKSNQITEEQITTRDKLKQSLSVALTCRQALDFFEPNPDKKNTIQNIISTTKELLERKSKIETTIEMFKELQASNNSFEDYLFAVLNSDKSFETKVSRISVLCTERYDSSANVLSVSGHSLRVTREISKLIRDQTRVRDEDEEFGAEKKQSKKAPKNTKLKYRGNDTKDESETYKNVKESKTVVIGEYWTSIIDIDGEDVKYRVHRDRYRVLKSREMFRELMERNDDTIHKNIAGHLRDQILNKLKKICSDQYVETIIGNTLDMYDNMIMEELYFGLYKVINHALTNRIIFNNSSNVNKVRYDEIYHQVYSFLEEIVEKTFCNPITDVLEESRSFDYDMIDDCLSGKGTEQEEILEVLKDKLDNIESVQRSTRAISLSEYERYVITVTCDLIANIMKTTEEEDYIFPWPKAINLLKRPGVFHNITEDDTQILDYIRTICEEYNTLCRIKETTMDTYNIVKSPHTISLISIFQEIYGDYKVLSEYDKLRWYCSCGNNKSPHEKSSVFYPEVHVPTIESNLQYNINQLISGQYLNLDRERLDPKIENKLFDLMKDYQNVRLVELGYIDVNQICIEFPYEFDFVNSDHTKDSELSSFEIKFKQVNSKRGDLQHNSIAVLNLNDILTDSFQTFLETARNYRTYLTLNTKSATFGYSQLSKEIAKNKEFENELRKVNSKYSIEFGDISRRVLFSLVKIENLNTRVQEFNAIDFGGNMITTFAFMTTKIRKEDEITVFSPLNFDHNDLELIKVPYCFPKPVTIQGVQYVVKVGTVVDYKTTKRREIDKQVERTTETEVSAIFLQKVSTGVTSIYKAKGQKFVLPYLEGTKLIAKNTDGNEYIVNLENMTSLFTNVQEKKFAVTSFSDVTSITRYDFDTKEHSSYQVMFYHYYDENNDVPSGSVIKMINMETGDEIFNWYLKGLIVRDLNFIPNGTEGGGSISILGLWRLHDTWKVRYGSIEITPRLRGNQFINSFDTEIELNAYLSIVNLLTLNKSAVEIIAISGMDRGIPVNKVLIGRKESTFVLDFKNNIKSVNASKLSKFFSVCYENESVIYNLNGDRIKTVTGTATWL